jgi:hypothetical protein
MAKALSESRKHGFNLNQHVICSGAGQVAILRMPPDKRLLQADLIFKTRSDDLYIPLEKIFAFISI